MKKLFPLNQFNFDLDDGSEMFTVSYYPLSSDEILKRIGEAESKQVYRSDNDIYIRTVFVNPHEFGIPDFIMKNGKSHLFQEILIHGEVKRQIIFSMKQLFLPSAKILHTKDGIWFYGHILISNPSSILGKWMDENSIGIMISIENEKNKSFDRCLTGYNEAGERVTTPCPAYEITRMVYNPRTNMMDLEGDMKVKNLKFCDLGLYDFQDTD